MISAAYGVLLIVLGIAGPFGIICEFAKDVGILNAYEHPRLMRAKRICGLISLAVLVLLAALFITSCGVMLLIK